MARFSSRCCLPYVLRPIVAMAMLASPVIASGQGTAGVKFGLPVLPPDADPPAGTPAAPGAMADGDAAMPPPGNCSAFGSVPGYNTGNPSTATGVAPWWRNVPNAERLPPGAYFLVRPKGPGYYSLKDVLDGNFRDAPPKWPILPFGIMYNSFFDNDFRYLDDPKNADYDPLNFLHRIHIGNDWLFNTGGEFRIRYNDESDSRLDGKNDDYALMRVRVYGDLWYRDIFRIYAEFITADSTPQTQTPLLVDRNSADFQNLFFDVKAGTYEDQPIYVRVGRQELLYGSERQVAPLDWFNTRRTFEGAKTFWQDDKFTLDVFGVAPVVPNPGGWSSIDDHSFFSGVWATYRPKEGDYIDLYYTNLSRANGAATGMGPYAGAYDTNTIGSRYAGVLDRRLIWDVEGILQFGRYEDRPSFAQALTTGVGYAFPDLPMLPQFWVVYDHGSGDQHPGTGVHSTFNQEFHFGHPVFGWIDDFGRDNMNDLSFQAECFPTYWITAWTQFHILRLDSPRDGLYNPGGIVLRQDPAGTAGTNVGEELNFVLNFHLSNHQDLLVAWVYFFAGSYIKKTGPPMDANTLWVQYSFRW